MIKLIPNLAIIILVLSSCTIDTIDVIENYQLELERQINLAVVELNNFAAAKREFRNDFGVDPVNINELYFHIYRFKGRLEEDEFTPSNYIDNSPAHRWWSFRLVKSGDELIGFEAISRENMAGGENYSLIYNLTTARYSGDGVELIDPKILPFLMEIYVDPTFLLVPGEEWNSEEFARRMLATRQVNWATISIGAIYNAIKMYRQDFGVDPPDVEDILDMEYIELSVPVQLWWTFTLVETDPIQIIRATSTSEMVMGEGLIIEFSTQTGLFSGSAYEYMSPWVETIFMEIPIYVQFRQP